MNPDERSLLVVAAHPDDEVLGCGATTYKKVRSGWTAHLIIMTGGITGRSADPSDLGQAERAALDKIKENSRRAAEVIGFSSVKRFDFPDNRMDGVSRSELAHALRREVERTRPCLVMTHHPGDYNWDHGRVFDAVMMAARVNPPEFSPAEIRTFEVPSSTERSWQEPSRAFHPNLYEDIRQTIDRKKLALTCYETECKPYPHARSIEAMEYIARVRGLEAGVTYAEAFHLVRRLEI